jgi:hypothetical protein
MNNERRVMAQIRDLLQSHYGKNKAIKSAQIASTLGIKDGETHPVIRSAITRLIIEEKMLIASCNFGYFIIETKEEYTNYIENLMLREIEMRRRSMAIKIGWIQKREKE